MSSNDAMVQALCKCLSQALQGQGGAASALGGLVGGTRGFEEQAATAVPALVRMFSGCMDAQTSADVFDVASFKLPADSGPGGAGGACTNSMIATLLQKPELT